jgi:hypothetical protein
MTKTFFRDVTTFVSLCPGENVLFEAHSLLQGMRGFLEFRFDFIVEADQL